MRENINEEGASESDRDGEKGAPPPPPPPPSSVYAALDTSTNCKDSD